MKSLVIAEKPSVARDIARVLKCGKNINGAIEGDRYVVTWGLGHLVTLADPEDYDKKYKEWKMEDLPMMPEVFKLEVIKQTSKQYQAVKTQIYRGDVGDIIIATDAGREGELVARLILKKTGCNKPIRRLWISSVTDKAIREGFANLKDGLVLTWQDAGTGSHRSFDRGRMEGLAQELKGETAVVAEVKRTPKKTQPPLLYDLTELQRDANKRFNYSAKDTLNIMQRLYENHKVLTYPRTDSRYLSADIVPTLKERLKACSVGPYKTLAGRLVNQPLPAKPFFVDNSKVSDHHAIIPTEQYVQMDHMTIDERRIYDLVVRRFLAVLYPPFEYDETSLEANIRGQRFIAKGRIVKGQGWKAAYDTAVDDGEEEDEPEVKDQQLPDLKKGDVLHGLSLKMTEGKTKPPAPFNEATLLSAMENPVAYMETKDKAMAKTLGETGGLGTVATRADIIEKLFSSFLLEKRGKDICLTSKARQLLELVPEDLKKPELTADWEMKLSGIAKGSLKRGAFMKDIRGYSQELIRQIKTGEGSFRHDNLTNTKCPVCGKRMLAVKGKNTEMLVCQDRECGHREVISRTSNARCPVCHKKMELKGKGDAQIFVCRCGHKEKLKAFEERRKKEGAGVTKKDVARYLNQQKKEAEEPVNNAFAKALAGLNLKDKG